MVHVPYRGSALAFPDIISNKVQLIFDNLPSALEQARGGKRARARRHLAAALAQRTRIFPPSPRPCLDSSSVGFYGISAPKGTPPEIVDVLKQGGRRGAERSQAGWRGLPTSANPEADDAGRIRQASLPTRPRNGARWSNSPGCRWIEAEASRRLHPRKAGDPVFQSVARNRKAAAVLDAPPEPVIGLAEGETRWRGTTKAMGQRSASPR